jgi:sulfate/thiosulfate transport system ATP-binding protein
VGLDSQGLRSGAGRLFVRPYDMAVVPVAEAPLAGRVTRIHGLGPARRIEIALRSQDGAMVEIDVPRSGELVPSQEVGLRPRTYRIFAAAAQ